MDRLTHVVIATGEVEGLKRYYELAGLTVRNESPQWVEFDTSGATLALAHDPEHRGIHLRFLTEDVDTRARELEERDVRLDEPGVQRFGWGAMATFADPEGRPITTFQPTYPMGPGGSGPLLTAVLNCRDMAGMKAFYRDTLGFPATVDSPWWVELSAGPGGLALHPRIDSGADGHHANDVTLGLAIPDLEEWYEEAKERGFPFSGPPHDRGFGLFADASDPDGNSITFRNMPMGESLEEELAEPFEDEVTPQRSAFRKPVRKGVKATSRVATRPEYHETRRPARASRSAKSLAQVASPRGTGPAGTRQKPKVKHDPKRARTKPAIGRLRKAERRTLESKKVAVAGASKSKPVKRASRPRVAKRTTSRARTSR
jgi:catechol 2,3-dioxygenase-like lactoylglutathione lyase family enzyme